MLVLSWGELFPQPSLECVSTDVMDMGPFSAASELSEWTCFPHNGNQIWLSTQFGEFCFTLFNRYGASLYQALSYMIIILLYFAIVS